MNLDAIVERFGLAGLALIALAGAVGILFRRANEVQDARIADAERNSERLVQLTNEVKDATREVGASLDTLTEVLRERGRNG